MKKTLTFIDSNVLIAAATGKGKQALRALAILNDPARETAERPTSPLKMVGQAPNLSGTKSDRLGTCPTIFIVSGRRNAT